MYITNVYVVTYHNEERINQNVKRFKETTKDVDKKEVTFNYHIINNHTGFHLHDEEDVTVLHNVLRPNESCGHLARDYNAALMHGFKNLKKPACDQVICVHDDSLWENNWFNELWKIHGDYTFYAGDYGCSFLSFLPEAVIKIGLWDERFCNIAYHEADYFLRALIYNSDKSSINDHFGGRVHNGVNKSLFGHPSPNPDKSHHMSETLPYHAVSRAVFAEKWGVHPEFWNNRLRGDLPKVSLTKNYVYYPWFERDVEDLIGKNYCYSEDFKEEWR